jgi:hypothetical protein
MSSSTLTEIYDVDSVYENIGSTPAIVQYNERTIIPINNPNLYEINSIGKDNRLSMKKRMQIIHNLDKIAEKPAHINIVKYKAIILQILELLKNVTLLTPIQNISKKKLIDDFVIRENKIIENLELLQHQLALMMTYDRSHRANERRRTMRAVSKFEKIMKEKSQINLVENSAVNKKTPCYFNNSVHLNNVTLCPNQNNVQNNVDTNNTLFYPQFNNVNTNNTLFYYPMNNGDTNNPLSYFCVNNEDNNSSFIPHVNNVDTNNTLFYGQN